MREVCHGPAWADTVGLAYLDLTGESVVIFHR